MAAPEGKIFNDPVHGHIEMPDLCVKIIDTPQFQRLRNIKQLGGCYYVYPGAAHNRFEHSIGTAHLAGCLVESLKTKQDLGISEKDVLCVKIAGLCHDLGHGPFSHLFDGSFIKQALQDPAKGWKHEQASLDMFQLIYENLKSDFEQHELGDVDATFIKELINCPRSGEDYKGRPKDKWFLYEIISNKESGIDVDKWDYFARDCLHLGMKSGFDHMRCIKMARVIKAEDGKWHICFRDKEVNNIYEMFHLRANLHRRAYQHKTSNAVQHMITEALLKAEPHLQFEGKDGKMLKMSEAIDDMEAYTKLTDQVYYQILYSTDEGLKEAKNILERIECRKLYRLIGEHTATEKDMSVIFPIQSEVAKKENPKKEDIILDCEKVKEEEILKKDEILKEAKVDEITKEDIILDKVKFDYGGKEKDPVKKVYFYKKQEPDKAFHLEKDEVSYMLPKVFIEWKIRLYLRKELDKAKTDQLREGFDKWFKQQVSRMLPQVFFEKEIRVYCKKRDPETIRKMKEAFTLFCERQGYQHKFYSYIEREEDKKPDEQLDQAEEPAVAQDIPQNTS